MALTPVREGAMACTLWSRCAGTEPRLSTPYMCKRKPHHSTLLTQRYIMAEPLQTQLALSLDCKKARQWTRGKRIPEWGSRDQVGRTPKITWVKKSSLNKKAPVFSPLLPPLQPTALLFSPPSPPPPPLREFPAQVSKLECTAHTLCICLQGISLSFSF